MKVTTKHLLKFLPIEEEVRRKVLDNLSSYNPDQKLALEKFCWSVFYEVLDSETGFEFEKALHEAGKENRKLEINLYQKIENQVYRRFMRNMADLQETEILAETRDNLKSMITKKVKNDFTDKKNGI